MEEPSEGIMRLRMDLLRLAAQIDGEAKADAVIADAKAMETYVLSASAHGLEPVDAVASPVAQRGIMGFVRLN